MNLNGLSRSLTQAGLITPENAKLALDTAIKEHISFIAVAVKKGYADPAKVASLVSVEFGLPLLDLAYPPT